MNVNYAQTGRWSQCGWCGCIYQHYTPPKFELRDNTYCGIHDEHYCGAPWQVKAKDIPEEWIAGFSTLTPKHYPESPFMAMYHYKWTAEQQKSSTAIPCS